MTVRNRIMGILRNTPGGLTSREIHARLQQGNYDSVSSHLCKMALYGQIDRQLCRSNGYPNVPHRWYIYRAKETNNA